MFVSFVHKNSLNLVPDDWVSFNIGIGDGFPGEFVTYTGQVIKTEEHEAIVRAVSPGSAKGRRYRVGYIRLIRVPAPPGFADSATEVAAVAPEQSASEPEWPSAIQKQGWEAFLGDLYRLMEHSTGKWVAYHGEEQVALADSKQEVYAQIGDTYPLTEIMVSRIEPPGPPVNLARPRRVSRG